MVKFSIASLTQIGLSLVLICWTTGSTGAAFSFEEEFLQLKENYIQMKEIVKNFESKVTELESKDVQMQEKDTKMEEKVTKLQEKVIELEDKVQQQDSLLISLLGEENERAAPTKQSTVAINGLPSSCGDLKMIGHIWSGFYSVMGSAMMEFVYCDFTKPPSDAEIDRIRRRQIGARLFYVQRNSSFNTTGTPIPFDLAVVNEGNAMNLRSGIFTAPRPGIYFFSFTGMAHYPVQFGVGLYVYEGLVGVGWVESVNRSPLTFQSTLNLKKDDQVWLQIRYQAPGAYLYDSSSFHFTHFTGFMLEEQIVASL